MTREGGRRRKRGALKKVAKRRPYEAKIPVLRNIIFVIPTTVEGEIRVASFLVNYFKRAPLPDTCGCAPLLGCTPKVPLLNCHHRTVQYNFVSKFSIIHAESGRAVYIDLSSVGPCK
jgi:hypothetical protein